MGPSIDDGYENIGGADHAEEITIDAVEDYEPEETYIIPNTAHVENHKDDTVSYDMNGKVSII